MSVSSLPTWMADSVRCSQLKKKNFAVPTFVCITMISLVWLHDMIFIKGNTQQLTLLIIACIVGFIQLQTK